MDKFHNQDDNSPWHVNYLGIFENFETLPSGLKEFDYFLIEDCMYTVMPDGSYYKLCQPKIVCAAHQFGNGIVVASPRHCDYTYHSLMMAIHRPDDNESGHPHFISHPKQGFVDQFGCFYTRDQALQIAIKAGQIDLEKKSPPKHLLFSEDLY